METLQALFSATLSIFQVPITIWGFTFSWWDVFIWSAVAGLVLAFIGGVFDGD
jgi:hypothetical protein